jgi:broad specificity phosphatase PhoE
VCAFAGSEPAIGGVGAGPRRDRSRIVAVRHGATEWSRLKRHTGRTDVPLGPEGRDQAMEVGLRLAGHRFRLVLTSPLRRARATCELAGFGEAAEVCDDLMEWDYGAMDGRTTEEIRRACPGWNLWVDGVDGGETVEQVGERADRVVALARSEPGDVLVFAHAHFLRVLAARWVGLEARYGSVVWLAPATLSVLDWERETPVIARWNETAGDPIDSEP